MCDPPPPLLHADCLPLLSSGALSHKDTLEEAIVSVKRNGVALCGTLRTPLGFMPQRSLNLQLRCMHRVHEAMGRVVVNDKSWPWVVMCMS